MEGRNEERKRKEFRSNVLIDNKKDPLTIYFLQSAFSFLQKEQVEIQKDS